MYFSLPLPLLSFILSSLFSQSSQAAATPQPYPSQHEIAARAFQAQPDVNCTKCFHVVNLFSYDQQIAIQSGAPIRGGSQNAQNNFVQFYLNDPGQPENGGAAITWDPNFDSPGNKETPPIGITKDLEFDASEKAELVEWNGPNDFSVNVTHL